MTSLKLNFPKVRVEKITRSASEGHAHCVGVLNKTVCKVMAWGDPQDWQKTANLIGKLAAKLVEFTPADSTLSKQAFDLDATSVDSFQLDRIEVKKGPGAKRAKSFKTVLKFKIAFTQGDGAARLESFMQSCPEAVLTVHYEKEPEQEELPTMQTQEQIEAVREIGVQ